MATFSIKQIQNLPSEILTKVKKHLKDINKLDIVHRGPVKPDEWKKLASILNADPELFKKATGSSLETAVNKKHGSDSEVTKVFVQAYGCSIRHILCKTNSLLTCATVMRC